MLTTMSSLSQHETSRLRSRSPGPKVPWLSDGRTLTSALQSSYRALASVGRCAVADRARLPSERVDSEGLVLPAVHAVLEEPGRMPWLSLDLGRCRLFRARFFLRDGFRQTLKVLLVEFELPHSLPY